MCFAQQMPTLRNAVYIIYIRAREVHDRNPWHPNRHHRAIKHRTLLHTATLSLLQGIFDAFRYKHRSTLRIIKKSQYFTLQAKRQVTNK